MSGAGVLAALQRRGVDAIAFDPAEQRLERLLDFGVSRVFIALHGRFGEDGIVQGALEMLGIAYTGSGVTASAVAIDKVLTKRVWLQHGLPTPRFIALPRDAGGAGNTERLRRLPDELGLPLIIKPPHEGSTIGVTKVTGYSEVAAAFELAARHDREVLAEEFIDGRELTVAILGSGASARALPIIEIRAPQGNYDFEHKYYSDDTQYLCPAALPDALARRISMLSVQAYRTLGCEGWARVDVMLRAADDSPNLIEINTSPGMTSHSLVPMAAKAEGIGYDDLVLQILASASLKADPGPGRQS
jgi:D-alanine-D-alanine ligase